MTCACAIAAYLGMTLPLLDGIPRTIQFEEVTWDTANVTETYTASGTIATSSDGSRAMRVRRTTSLFHMFGKGQTDRLSIYTQTPHAAYLIDHERRTAYVIPCKCTWERYAHRHKTHGAPLPRNNMIQIFNFKGQVLLQACRLLDGADQMVGRT